MILDLDHFVEREQGFWQELESFLRRVDEQLNAADDIAKIAMATNH